MSGWKTFRVGDLVEPVKSWNPLRSDPGDTFQYVDLSAVDQSLKRIVAAREVPCAEAPSRAKQLVKANDVLVSTVRPNLNGVAQVEQELDGSTASTGFCVLRPRAKLLSSSYLFHWVKTDQFIADMVRKATGASYPAVSDRTILESTIAAPPIEEQNRIAAILDQAAALRAKRREALAQLESLTQSILLDLLKDEKHIKSLPLANIVQDMHQGINTVTEKIEYQAFGLPIIQSKHITQGYLDLSDARFVSDSTFEKYKGNYQPEAGDMLLCNIGTIGKSLLIENCPPDFLVAWNLFLIKFRRDLVEPCYCKCYLDYLFVSHHFDQFMTGGTVKFISKRTFSAIPIQLPSIESQREFAAKISSLETVKNVHQESLVALDTLFASLQHRAFRGEL